MGRWSRTTSTMYLQLQQFYTLINEDSPNHEHQYSNRFLIAWVLSRMLICRITQWLQLLSFYYWLLCIRCCICIKFQKFVWSFLIDRHYKITAIWISSMHTFFQLNLDYLHLIMPFWQLLKCENAVF